MPRGSPEKLYHRVLRLLPVCMAVKPLARIILVILQSVPDMANIIALILFFMLVSALPHIQLNQYLKKVPDSLGHKVNRSSGYSSYDCLGELICMISACLVS